MLLLLGLCLGLPLCAVSLEEAKSWGDTSERVGLRVPRQVRLLQRLKTKPLMTEFSVKSTIISRYAFTTVSCRMLNRASEDQEVEFLMQIPAAAFITNFTMLIGDKVYQGEITEREKKNGDKIKEKRNKTEDNGERGTETFRASLVIPSKEKAVFLLSYEELLQRRLGKYEHVISVRPQQLVGKLTVEVNILERSGIASLEVLPLLNSRQKGSGRAEGGARSPPSTVINQNETFAKVFFKPSVIQQARIAQNGILGDFIIQYDVNREQSVGDIQVLNDYFVHYFAPKDLPPLPKNVVFVLDTSASMVGTKLRQTKDALFTILHDLRPQDHFSIIGFSNRIKVWQDHLVSVTPDNIRDAKVYIHHMSPTGGTDINGALQRAIRLLNNYVAHNDIEDRSVSLIIFLTDGKPTVGETHTLTILNNTKEAARGQVCIFTIGIGNDVDFKLLEKLSLENCGLTRRVHEEDDAGSQLIGSVVCLLGTRGGCQGVEGWWLSPTFSFLGPALKKPYNPRIKISKTSADGDPHFVVDFPLNKLTVCFNIDGQPGDILRLVSDHVDSGVTVNGELIGAPAPPNGHKKQRTYFRTITILVNKPERSYLEVTPRRVILDGGDRLVLPCNQSVVVGSRGLEVSVSANANITVTIQGTVAFVILIHLYKKPAPYQRDHLGFYISNSKGLSGNCHGLLGQFLNQDARLTAEPAGLSKNATRLPLSMTGEGSEAVLKVKGHQVPVVWKQRKIYNGEAQIDCWFARNAAQLLDGEYKDYLAAHPFDSETTFGLGLSRGL
ncbi:PREDICTED: inter-alpha-trypsin inhibitor heavy chain H5 [Hipposideros armiger]|uniref:Inter-alpha-trypsin inhibitor heavy chain H5 n=1 Tax=Hipposideros armiger TaxID=186990 RepID=A0A8B7RG90_HIPAR|nr:PREDICTED: inter-alpha-trypsin inhibitor heavy chain H5 [Hipposideros armiger]